MQTDEELHAEIEKVKMMPMNEYKRKMVIATVEAEHAYDKLLFQKGKENLFAFNKFVLNVEEGKMQLGGFHKELCKFVQDDRHKKKLILMPRGHLKSTLITIGYSLHQIINNPNIRILILNATWQMAVDFLTEIKRHLQANETLIDLYGNLANEAEEWSQDRITLKRADQNIKGPTVWATGVESNLVGSHPDLIILDDVVNRDNIETRESIEKVILRYKDALDLLEPGGQLIVIGTKWAEGDLYDWLMDKETGVREQYDVMVKRAYEGDLVTGEGFIPLWPEKFTREELLERLHGKGWYEFSSQYLNDSIPNEAAIFKKSWFQHFDMEDIRGKELTKIITIDPAISLEKEADFTAMIVSGIDVFGNIYILDIVRGHYTPNQIINKIFELNNMWSPKEIGIETVAFQKALAYTLREEMKTNRKVVPIRELKTQDRSKDQRIKGLQPSYENGKIFHRNGHPLTVYLEDELSKFPRGRHDDLCFSAGTKIKIIHGSKNIEDIKVGEKVLTRKGYKKVIQSGSTGIHKVIKRFGITATPNHPFITKKGIKRFDNLNVSDILHVWNEKQFCIEERSIIDILNQRGINLEFTSGDMISGKHHPLHFIDKFGLIILERYLKKCLFITKMVILLIIKYLIFFLLVNMTTLFYILTNPIEKKWEEKILKLLKRLQKSGTLVQLEENGIKSMQENNGNILKYIRRNVFNVEKNTKHLIKIRDFAKNNIAESYTENYTKVYNLQVEGSHEYFANNILVHNCDALSYALDLLFPPRQKSNRYHNQFLY